MSVGDPAFLGRRYSKLGAAAREAVRAELQRIISSAEFRNAPRLIRFLRYVSARSFEDDFANLKESVIGVEVFGRAPDWDPKSDSVVRTEARRTRLKLSEFYQNAGSPNGVSIELPKGGYAIQFALTGIPAEEEEIAEVVPSPVTQTAPIKKPRPLPWIAAGLLAAIAGLVFLSIQSWREGRLLSRGIAVAEFRTSEPHLEYVAYSLATAIKERLCRVPGARVVVWRLAGNGKNDASDIVETGKKLGVSLVLTGRIENEPGTGGSQALWDAQLVRTSDGSILWAGHQAVIPTDTAAAEQAMFTSVARVLRIAAPGPPIRPENPRAHDLYLQGRYLWQERDHQDVQKAIELYNAALRIDPDCASAYAGLADAYALLSANGMISADEGTARGMAAGKRAVTLDPLSAVAHGALGLLAYDQWNWNMAQAEYEQALRLNPNYALIYLRLALVAFAKGNFAYAEKLLGRARDLDPLSSSIRATMGQLYFYDRKYDDALEIVRPLIEADPHAALAHEVRMWVWAARDDPRRAHEEFLQIPPESELRISLGEEVKGEFPMLFPAERRARLAAALEKQKSGQFVNPLDLAAAAMALRDRNAALGYLEEALHEHVTDLISVRFDPVFSPLLKEPRFHAIYRQMGLQ